MRSKDDEVSFCFDECSGVGRILKLKKDKFPERHFFCGIHDTRRKQELMLLTAQLTEQ